MRVVAMSNEDSDSDCEIVEAVTGKAMPVAQFELLEVFAAHTWCMAGCWKYVEHRLQPIVCRVPQRQEG